MLACAALPLACGPRCTLASTLPGFVPQCDVAVLARYSDESRLVILGSQGGALVGYLPAPLQSGPYGDTTGRSLTVIVDGDPTDFLATPPLAWLNISDLTVDSATVDITAEFDQGWVDGTTTVLVEQRD